jgi:sterol desaturase/sphingolipid hydroxylase (fatty acid hydroxylase superfamily)
MASSAATATTPSADLTRPLLVQVTAMGEAYDAWVHDSVSPNAAAKINEPLAAAGDPFARRWPRSLRIFRSPFLELQSHLNWWVIPIVWIPIIVALFVAARAGAGLPADTAWVWAVIGLGLWTLAEYALHRFVFHYRPKSGLGRALHFLGHGVHHLDPWDPTRLVMPIVPGLVIASVLFLLHWLVLPLGPSLASMAGLLVGYVVYDLTHYYTHHARPRTRWGKYLKAWHLAHHHKYPRRLYGVSSPLWDFVFRTGKPTN